MAKAGTAVAKARVQLPVDINEQFAAEAAEMAKRLAAPGGDKIQVTQSKLFKLPDGRESPGPLSAIIVDFVSANYFYPNAYQRDNFTPATCYAIGMEPAGLAPFDSVPKKESEACAGCWANQYKSDLNGGNGKACQNTRLLALLDPTGDMDTPLMILKVSATGIRNFDGYVASVIRAFGKPVRSVVTTIGFNPAVEYPSLVFTDPQPVAPELLAIAQARKQEALTRLLTEPDPPAPVVETPKRVPGPSRKAPPPRK